jgi:hypothetical protein
MMRMSLTRRADQSLIIASVNGNKGQGYLETVERADGSIQRTGLLRLSASSALRVQRLVDNREPLIYSGPVLAHGRWCADTLPIVAMSILPEPGAPSTVCVMVCESTLKTVAA